MSELKACAIQCAKPATNDSHCGEGSLPLKTIKSLKQLKAAETSLKKALKKVRKFQQGGFLRTAYREFDLAWPGWQKDEFQRYAVEDIVDLLTVFSTQGHSGSSYGYVLRIFNKLAKGEILSPLTFKDDEFNKPYTWSPESRQNKRLSSVFKHPDGFRYIDDIVWHGKYRFVKTEYEKSSKETRFLTNCWNTYTGAGPYVIDKDGNCKGLFRGGHIKDTSTWKPETITFEIFEAYNNIEKSFTPFMFEDNPQIAEYAKNYTYTIEPADDWGEMLEEYDGLLKKAVALAVKAKAEGDLEKYCIAEETYDLLDGGTFRGKD